MKVFRKLTIIIITVLMCFQMISCESQNNFSHKKREKNETLSSDKKEIYEKDSNDTYDVNYNSEGIFDEQQNLESSDTSEDYIKIFTAEDLYNISNNMDGKYMLMNDIDLLGELNKPIAMGEEFCGELDGNGYVIKNVYIEVNEDEITDNVGLFSEACGAKFKNLGIEGSIIGIGTEGYMNVGSFVGYAHSKKEYDANYNSIEIPTSFTNCWTKATVASTVSDLPEPYNLLSCVGGFVGWGNANFKNCYNIGKVSTAHIYEDQSIGGFIGSVSTIGKISIDSCYNACEMDFGFTRDDDPGAFASDMYTGYNHLVKNSYYCEVVKKYVNSSVKVDEAICDFDDSDFDNVKALTESEIKNKTSFKGFDFSKEWECSSNINDGRPYLRVQKNP